METYKQIFLLEELIKNNISNLDADWFKKKRREFTKSSLYNSDQDCLIFKNIEIPSYTEDIIDEEGKIIGIKYYEGDEMSLEEKYDFKDFCLASNQFKLDEVYYPNPLGELEQFHGISLSIYEKGLHDFANDLLIELTPIVNEVPTSEIWKFIIRVQELLTDELFELKKQANDIHIELLTYYQLICHAKIYNSWQNKIEANRYCNLNNEKINIDLSLEELASLLVILGKAGTIEVNSYLNHFFEKNFTTGNPEKRKPIKASNFKTNISRVCNPDYFGKRIDKIKEIFDRGIKEVMGEIDRKMNLKKD